MVDDALRCRQISHGYGDISILDNLSLTLPQGQLSALVAPSGTGKSTLLHIAGLLERPRAGEVWINGQSAWSLTEQGRARLRRDYLGFVFQFHHLLPEFTAAENILFPLRLAGWKPIDAEDRVAELLDRVGLSHRKTHLPAELSGGEQQRIAIARALANRPNLILADEPTGNLDPKTATQIFELLLELINDQGASALIVTHATTLAERCVSVYHLKEGCLHLSKH